MQALLRSLWCHIVGVEEREVGGFEPRHMVAYLAVQLRETRARAERAGRDRDAALARAERAERDRDTMLAFLRNVLTELHTDPCLGPALRDGCVLRECWRTLEAAERRCRVGRDGGNGDGVEAPPW